MRLIRFPGEPAMLAEALWAQSVILGDGLVAKDVVETASSKGDASGGPFEEAFVGFSSGESRGGGDGRGEGPFGLSFGLFLSLLQAVSCVV